MPDAFVVATPAAAVTMGTNRSSQVSFTVTNIAGRPLRARLRVVAQEPTKPEWLAVGGPAERDFALGGTESFVVTVTVPPAVPAGTYTFRADAVGEEQPDEDFAQGPTVAVSVPAVVIKKRPPWLIPLIIAIIVVILAVVIFVVISKSGKTTTTPTATPTTTARTTASPTPSPTPTVPPVQIPQLINVPLSTAILNLTANGLQHKVNYISQGNVSCDPPVVAVNPPGGTSVPRGTVVVLSAQRPFFFCANLPE